MSGIAGIFYRDNRPVYNEQLEKIGKALSHRGPDGISYYLHDSIGLVHCMLHDTPESLFEKLPYQTKDKRFVITFHGRIDNREELCKKTDWHKPLTETPDSHLILAAYDKWGNGCSEYLLGDFAFAIWDEKEQKLFCARDHMGIKPFYYYLDDKCFVFASEIKGILALPQIPRAMNEERVADYFTSVVIDKESTFYKNISRLSPGHIFIVKAEKITINRFHQFRPTLLQSTTDSEYEEQFREIFADAVRCRLRSNFLIGSYLSGGLDSASIVCTAAGLFADLIPSKFQTFSGIFDKLTQCDERKYFLPVIKRYNLISHQLPIDNINPSVAYKQLMNDEDEPFWAPHVFMSMALLSIARKAGIRVLLDGHDGDSAISHGYSLFTELALSGKIIQLAKCFEESGVNSQKSTIKKIFQLYWNIYCIKIRGVFLITPFKMGRLEVMNKLNPKFARKTKVKQRLVEQFRFLPVFGQKESLYHYNNITQPMHPYALEFLERIAIKYGIITRYPFFDKRLIEFCLAIPAKQKFQFGMNRSIVRRALSDLLPDEVACRRSKTDFTPSLIHAFSENDNGWLFDSVDMQDDSRYNYLCKSFYLKIIEDYSKKNKQHRCLVELLKLISFSKWQKRIEV